VRYYGCPAEEQLTGKVFMARAGVFDDLDCALNYHPGSLNMPGKGTAVGVRDYTFRFHGTTAHAGGSPHEGRSALDAVELMNVGVNYLREHVTEKVRIHYAITRGGDVPNIVPAEAEVWYFLRAPSHDELDQVAERVRKVAEGAAMMTETTVEVILNGACSTVLNNHYLADLHYQAMQMIGPIAYTDEELEFARTLNEGFAEENARDPFNHMRIPPEMKSLVDAQKSLPIIGENFPAMDEDAVATGSTDVGDVSWITPLTMFRTTCFTTRASGHSWGVTATSGMSIGHKGMMHAAKTMAAVAVDLFSDPKHIDHARAEWSERTAGQPYVLPIPEDLTPPR
ncbi:MAG: amidohydrolase, partial [Spirochaetales bacterium]